MDQSLAHPIRSIEAKMLHCPHANMSNQGSPILVSRQTLQTKKPLSYADSRERLQWVERENACFHSLFVDDKESVKTRKINGLQVVTISILGVRRQYQKRGKSTLNFQILDAHQRQALIEFLKFDKKGWKTPTDSNSQQNCQTENSAHGLRPVLKLAWMSGLN